MSAERPFSRHRVWSGRPLVDVEAMNRAERRAARRRQEPQLLGFNVFVTYDEAVLVEEAMAGYVHELHEAYQMLTVSARHEWALERAELIRASLAAALENRPYKDLKAQREEPLVAPEH